MEKLIEDLIEHIEIQKHSCMETINELSCSNDKSLEYIYAGKVFAFDYCINELNRIVLNYNLANE